MIRKSVAVIAHRSVRPGPLGTGGEGAGAATGEGKDGEEIVEEVVVGDGPDARSQGGASSL